MGFEDKTLECLDCGNSFVFSADEQELFASKGYQNDPKRCLPCRQSRRTRRDDSDGYGYRPRREMFAVVCAKCGKDAEVPFEPREGRPVYCSDCFAEMRMNRS